MGAYWIKNWTPLSLNVCFLVQMENLRKLVLQGLCWVQRRVLFLLISLYVGIKSHYYSDRNISLSPKRVVNWDTSYYCVPPPFFSLSTLVHWWSIFNIVAKMILLLKLTSLRYNAYTIIYSKVSFDKYVHSDCYHILEAQISIVLEHLCTSVITLLTSWDQTTVDFNSLGFILPVLEVWLLSVNICFRTPSMLLLIEVIYFFFLLTAMPLCNR